MQGTSLLAAEAGQRVYECRFADIGPPEKAYFGHAGIDGEVEEARGRVEELRAAEDRVGAEEIGFGWQRGGRCAQWLGWRGWEERKGAGGSSCREKVVVFGDLSGGYCFLRCCRRL